MHFLLFYQVTPDYVERRAAFREEHLKLAWESAARGELILGGALTDPVDTAVLLFRADSAKTVRDFAKNDPYVKNGLVASWRVRQWATVVGDDASSPIRVR
jgi:uncharacterized protein YciI